MKLNYVGEKVAESVWALIREGTLRDRVKNAASRFIIPDTGDLPLPVDINNLLQRLRHKLYPDDKTIAETVAGFSEDDLNTVAGELLTLYVKLREYSAAQQAAA